MPEYRRIYQNHSMYFFTVVTYKRQVIFNNKNAVNYLRETIRTIKRNHPFSIEAMVVLPDHIHCVWNMDQDDCDYSKRWKLIKMSFTKGFHQPDSQLERSASRVRKRERTVWQRRFWEHLIRDESDLHRHYDYIHYNPVRHGYVKSPDEWPWSSFHRFVDNGWYERDWGADEPTELLGACVGE